MKKLVKYGVLPACLLLLAACSSKPATEKKQAKEDAIQSLFEKKLQMIWRMMTFFIKSGPT